MTAGIYMGCMAQEDTIVIHDTLYVNKETTQTKILTKYEKKEAKYHRIWSYLIPRNTIVQYAGNIGMLSFGAGWTYGKKRRWSTDLLFGFLPKSDSECAKITMTLKENYYPWTITLNKKRNITLTPLSCGIFLIPYSGKISGHTNQVVIPTATMDFQQRYVQTSI